MNAFLTRIAGRSRCPASVTQSPTPPLAVTGVGGQRFWPRSIAPPECTIQEAGNLVPFFSLSATPCSFGADLSEEGFPIDVGRDLAILASQLGCAILGMVFERALVSIALSSICPVAENSNVAWNVPFGRSDAVQRR